MPTEPAFLDACTLSETELALAESLLTADERAQTARMKERRRRERLGARLLAARCLAGRFAVPLSSIRFERDAVGRPRTPDLPGFWSVSHSFFLCAFYWSETPVGVDVERIRPFSPRLERLLSDEERRLLGLCGDMERKAFFFRLWTAKEALVKALDLPLLPQTLRSLPLTVGACGLTSEAGQLAGGRYGHYVWAVACRKSSEKTCVFAKK